MPNRIKLIGRFSLIHISILAILVLGLAIKSDAGQGGLCKAPELITYQITKYNEIVCEGVDRQKRGDIEGAITAFERALKLPLFEEPNVYLFPRLAYLYAISGNVIRANEYLTKARVFLEVYHGIAKCVLDYEYTPGLDLERLYDRGEIGILKSGKILNDGSLKSLFFEICQTNIVDYYDEAPDLDAIVVNPLVEIYRKAIKETMRKSDSKPSLR